MKRMELIAPERIPEITKGDDLPRIIVDALAAQNESFQQGDVLIVTHKVVSKAEGRVYPLQEVRPSDEAFVLAGQCGKPPALVQLILDESQHVMRARRGVLIMRHRLGLVCANAGVDQSNSGGPSLAVLLPENPDKSAKAIFDEIRKLTGRSVPVIISDSHGRPFRNGAIGAAIGCYGIHPLRDYRGKTDRQGYLLKSSVEAIADELCCAASILMGQSDESLPAVLIRGAVYEVSDDPAGLLQRPAEQDLFLQDSANPASAKSRLVSGQRGEKEADAK